MNFFNIHHQNYEQLNRDFWIKKMFRFIIAIFLVIGGLAEDTIVAPNCEEPVLAGFKAILDKCEMRANPIPMGKLT